MPPSFLFGLAMKRVSLRHFRSFAAVAETGSFTLAATRLFVTQSSLTATIRQFEEDVGVTLFERTSRRVVMTEDAVRFKPIAERVIREFDNAVSDLAAIAKSQRGHVRIAAAPSMIVHLLTPALTAFRQKYPDITISVRDGGSDKIEKVVLDGEADFGLASRLNGYEDLNYVPILTDNFGVVFPTNHPLASDDAPLKWSELGKYDLISLTNDTGIGAFLENYPDLGLGDKSHPHDRASSTNALFAMLSLGGDKVSVLPALAAHAGELKAFRFRELIEPTISREICLITRHLRSFSPNTKRILIALREATLQAKHLSGAKGVSEVAWAISDEGN
ncbi:MAG: LysR family transcriptional regulator [Bradyrhizobium sp.]|nr:LysR family transcriptional regulator [Bradyrhizobium sp.]